MIKPKGFSASIANFISGNDAVLVLSDSDSSKGLTSVCYLKVKLTIDGSSAAPVIFEKKINGKDLPSSITLTGTSSMSVSSVSTITAIVTIESRKKVSNPITLSPRIGPAGGKKK